MGFPLTRPFSSPTRPRSPHEGDDPKRIPVHGITGIQRSQTPQLPHERAQGMPRGWAGPAAAPPVPPGPSGTPGPPSAPPGPHPRRAPLQLGRVQPHPAGLGRGRAVASPPSPHPGLRSLSRLVLVPFPVCPGPGSGFSRSPVPVSRSRRPHALRTRRSHRRTNGS